MTLARGYESFTIELNESKKKKNAQNEDWPDLCGREARLTVDSCFVRIFNK